MLMKTLPLRNTAVSWTDTVHTDRCFRNISDNDGVSKKDEQNTTCLLGLATSTLVSKDNVYFQRPYVVCSHSSFEN